MLILSKSSAINTFFEHNDVDYLGNNILDLNPLPDLVSKVVPFIADTVSTFYFLRASTGSFPLSVLPY
jgi:hypothetical protein